MLNKLTHAAVKAAAPDLAKPYKLADGGGMYLFVTPAGAKSWRLKYRYMGKEKLLTLGLYPSVSLAEAREKRDSARAHLRADRDPAFVRREAKRLALIATNATFEVSARAWHEDQLPRWTKRHAAVVISALERDVFPDIGNLPISKIDGQLILWSLRKIEKRGSIETAKRVLGYIRLIFIRARAERLVADNPALDLIHALKPTPRGSKQPAITSLPGLLALQQAVDRSTAGPRVKLASRLLAMTSVRVGVLRTATWNEFEGIDWDDADADAPSATWKISAERMKLEIDEKGDSAYDHDVPLSAPAVSALRALRELTGRCDLLFPNQRSTRVAMSDAAISGLYKRLGAGRYNGVHVPHGWRAAFSTVMNEWAIEHGREGDRMLIDLMLAHKPKGISGSEFAYMRAKFSARRRVLAGTWATMVTEGLDDPATILSDRS